MSEKPSDEFIPESENPFSSTDDDDEEEFSIEQLSEAYAKVIKEQNEESGQSDGESEPEPEEVDNEESAETDLESDKADAEDLLDDEPCEVSPLTILEAVLFVGAPQGTTLTSRKIAALMRDVSPKEVNSLIKELNKKYESENAPYRIVKEDKAVKMELAPDFAQVKEKFYGEVRAARLSQPAVDVLAVVAYHQPVTREQVDKLRLRSSGSLLSQLVRRQLLTIQQTETKPYKKQFITTERFLKLFGLESLHDLPQTHEVSSLDELAS